MEARIGFERLAAIAEMEAGEKRQRPLVLRCARDALVVGERAPLAAGDRLRLGTPGVEVQLIKVAR